MYSALDIAVWFLFKNNSELREKISDNDKYEVYEGITHLKLQKLLYYAQGVTLAEKNETLFVEALEAWPHGPVIREVYNVYNHFGRDNIDIPFNNINKTIVNNIEEDKDISDILDIVYKSFAIYTAWQLREMSHKKNGPWDQAISKKESIINIDIIKNYFKKEIMA